MNLWLKNIDQCLCSNQPKNTEEGPLVIAIRDMGKSGGKSASSKMKKVSYNEVRGLDKPDTSLTRHMSFITKGCNIKPTKISE